MAQALVPGAARALGRLSQTQSSPSRGSPTVSSPAHTLGSVRVPAAELWPELLAASFLEHLICSLGVREARDRAAVVRACCVPRQACSFSALGRLLGSREVKRNLRSASAGSSSQDAWAGCNGPQVLSARKEVPWLGLGLETSGGLEMEPRQPPE